MSVSDIARRDASPGVVRPAVAAGRAQHAPLPAVDPTRTGTAWPAAKRVIDVVLALLFLLAALPLLALIALLIRLDSPGPVLFRQTRCGRHCRRFTVLKFRTMAHGADHAVHRDYIAALARGGARDGGLKKLTGDSRVTRVGALLRRSSLDELPQLFNVVLGDMSIVGPRPAIDYELQHYEPAHYARFHVRPGLTGLWQVSGRSRLGFTEMLALDAEYAHRSGPLLDARIIARTPLEILRGRAS